jgi:hypothetical protein
MRNAGHAWYISEAHDGTPFDLKTKDFCAMKVVCALLPPTSWWWSQRWWNQWWRQRW